MLDENNELLNGDIVDPWHSRVLDVHRWSDHPEIVQIVNAIWDANFAQLEGIGRSGPRPKQGFRCQLRVLILDLYVAWCEDPDLCIAVSMSQNDWQTWSRYNALRISKRIILLIHELAKAGMIVLARGSYGGPYARGNRTTRIKAAEPLIAMFQSAKMTRDDIRQVEEQECIILKSGEGDLAKLVEYEDTPDIVRMRRDLVAYNALLAETFIDIPTLDDPWLTRNDDHGREVRVQIDPHHQLVRRIFSRGDWRCNGRFYGPWWQQIGKEWRGQIFLNDTPTVEVDFKGLHVSMLSAEKGVIIEGDPYTLPVGQIPGVGEALQRSVIKKLVLTALNARDRKSAFASFRDGFPKGHVAKGLTNVELERLLATFTEQHPHLEECLCADQGIRLMNLDSQIAEIVHRWFVRRRVPVLSVHDSFIIDVRHVRELKRVMGLASRRVVGRGLPVEASAVGQDELEGDEALDYRTWRETPRSSGYLQRLTQWEKKKGREVIPHQ